MNRLPNIHPGEIRREEFLNPMGIGQYRLAKAIGVPAMRISGMCAGTRSVTADTALRFSRAFGTTPRPREREELAQTMGLNPQRP